MNIKAQPLGDASKHEVRKDLEQWIGMLGGPILWLVQFQTIYSISGWGCALHSKAPLYLTSGVFLVLSILTGFIAARHLHPAGGDTAARRTKFMARVGVLISSLFSLAIIAQALATIILSQCME
jgi:hypothetical protein